MARLLLVLGVVAVVLLVYTLVDCAMLDRSRVRGLPRWAWIVVMLLLPVVGSILWLIIGRGKPLGGRGQMRQSAPDDDLEFLRQLDRESVQQDRIRKLEEQLSQLDTPDEGDSDAKPGSPPASPPPSPRKPDATGESDAGQRDA